MTQANSIHCFHQLFFPLLSYYHPIYPPTPRPPCCPVPLLTNPYNYVGHKGLDLAAGPKRGSTGRAGGGAPWKFLLFLSQYKFQTKSKQLAPSPVQNPFLPTATAYTLRPVITFRLEMQPDHVLRDGGEPACALWAIVEKELTRAWMGSHLIGKISRDSI